MKQLCKILIIGLALLGFVSCDSNNPNMYKGFDKTVTGQDSVEPEEGCDDNSYGEGEMDD